MIEFVLDGRSKVNTYMQLVQQVKQALRVGLLDAGRPVAEGAGRRAVAGDQPEHGAEGLPRAGDRGAGRRAGRASARSSSGTLAGPSLANQAELRDGPGGLAATGRRPPG